MKNKIVLVSLMLLSFLSNAQNSKEVSQEWISISQFLDVTVEKDTKFKLIGFAKADLVDDKAMAALWARVDNEGGELGFFDNMGDRPIRLNEWKSYTIEGVLTKDARTLNFGALCYGNGTYLFDEFQLFIENSKGVLAPVTIDNSSFESGVSNGIVPKWSQGIGRGKVVKVKEFEISSSDDAAKGKKSLKLVGAGIELSVATIGNVEGASPQIGSMISMLEDLKSRVESRVKNMSTYELDHLHDEKANRIGALIMHLAAAEKYYQVFTFEGRGFNEEENEIWLDALNLGAAARDKYKGHEVQYYLDIYNEVRAETIAELKKRDDKWFEEIQPSSDISNHYCWFHVMEHQSSHLGQILFLAKRIPPEVELTIPEPIKD